MTLRTLLAATALVLPACAAFGAAQGAAPTDPMTRGSSELRGSSHASSVPQLDFTAQHLSFPALRSNADLPSADAVAMHMEKVLGDSAAADVAFCVDDHGAVQATRLLRSSGLAAYDAAVLADLKTWQFEAPTGDRCTTATIVYTLR